MTKSILVRARAVMSSMSMISTSTVEPQRWNMPQEKIPGPGRRPVENPRPPKNPGPDPGKGGGGIKIHPPKKDK